MTVVDSLNNLAPKEFGLEFRHLPVWLCLEVAMQTATIDELHNQENLLMGLKGFVKLSNVGVVQLLHNLHFSLDTLSPVGLHQFDLLVYFDSDLLVEHLVETEAHHSVSSLAKPLADEVVVEVLNRTVRRAELNLTRVWLTFVFVHLRLVQGVSIVVSDCLAIRGCDRFLVYHVAYVVDNLCFDMGHIRCESSVILVVSILSFEFVNLV